jgi:hypothetical protein
MSKPVDPDSAPTAQPMIRRHPPSRLHENFKVAGRMKPYVNRLRLQVADLDVTDPSSKQRLENARREMTDLLINKKVRKDLAQQAVAQALDIAADYQLEALRREQNLKELKRSQSTLERLLEQLDALVHAMSKLPPLAKGKLNKIVAGQDWKDFDSETFTELIHAIIHALSTSSPKCIADRARSAVIEPVGASRHPAVAQIVRTAPPAILDLWKLIPAQTRTQVEAGLRTWVPPRQRPMTKFLNRLIFLLENFRPRLKKGRRGAIEGRFGKRLARLWLGLGLHVGRAFNGEFDRHVESSFQRFARLALTAVGDQSRISSRQIDNLKSSMQRPR